MRRRYYVHYWRDFGNCYNLYHAPADFVPPAEWAWDRITRKKAESLARAESYRRKTNPAFAYYADRLIYPHDWDEDNDDLFWALTRGTVEIDGVIVRRVKGV